MELHVTVSSIGARERLPFYTVDISESGALINGGPIVSSFHKDSILEVNFDLGSGQKPISCLAKAVRSSGARELGIKFIQIDDYDQRRLQAYLYDLAVKCPELKC
jgi:c-di-GMP-binding flagellar brake protein YcgR